MQRCLVRGSRRGCKTGTRSAGSEKQRRVRGAKRVGEAYDSRIYPRGSYAAFVALSARTIKGNGIAYLYNHSWEHGSPRYANMIRKEQGTFARLFLRLDR